MYIFELYQIEKQMKGPAKEVCPSHPRSRGTAPSKATPVVLHGVVSRGVVSPDTHSTSPPPTPPFLTEWGSWKFEVYRAAL